MAININQINQNNNYGMNEKQVDRIYSALAMGRTIQGTGDMGLLIPIHIQELIPSQKININYSSGLQFTPFVSNLFHEINGEIMTYAIPLRLLMDDWEEFITGGRDGQYNGKIPSYEPGTKIEEGSIYDYLGFPITQITSESFEITKLPARAYNLIYNEQIRNPDTNPDEIDLDSQKLQRGYWDWSYLTRARVFQMRGITPSIPVSDEMIQLEHEIQTGKWNGENWEKENSPNRYLKIQKAKYGSNITKVRETNKNKDTIYGHDDEPNGGIPIPTEMRIMPHNLEKLGMNVNDLLVGIGIMKVQVNNARTEPRYVDQLKMRFGIFPQDARLQRPEYLGTEYFNITTDTVTQTAPGTDRQTPQGNITGQAWGAGQNMTFNYKAVEHTYIMSIMCIKPKPVYEGGLNRIFIKNNRFDFPTPELVNLPDTPVFKGEVHYSGKEKDKEIFGWHSIYEEYRTLENIVCGKLRPSQKNNLVSYTLARFWTDDDNPTLNKEFLECNPDQNRILQYQNEPAFIYFIRANIKTSLPLPIISEPGEMSFL